MLDEQAAQLDAGEETTGASSIWRQVYALIDALALHTISVRIAGAIRLAKSITDSERTILRP